MIKSTNFIPLCKCSIKGFFVEQIQNFYKACDLVHLCAVGSELLHLGLNIMNIVDLSKKGVNFSKILGNSPWRVIITNLEIHQQIAMASKSARKASCIRTCNIFSEIMF